MSTTQRIGNTSVWSEISLLPDSQENGLSYARAPRMLAIYSACASARLRERCIVPIDVPCMLHLYVHVWVQHKLELGKHATNTELLRLKLCHQNRNSWLALNARKSGKIIIRFYHIFCASVNVATMKEIWENQSTVEYIYNYCSNK